ncbi:hypothetical protein [Endozoicomonas sp. ALC013]|uniref:hypothetical protein n=1 Tax=Endozoicomonas sp. ALC013 TaxID=3403076 RepID=UPI003BB4A7C5
MEKLFLALMFSSSVFAQTQSPIHIGGKDNIEEAIRMTRVTTVEIKVSSISKSSDYEITVDGEVIDTTGVIQAHSTRKIDVPLIFKTSNKPQRFQICSVSIPGERDLFRTRVCTNADLVFII